MLLIAPGTGAAAAKEETDGMAERRRRKVEPTVDADDEIGLFQLP